MMISSLTLILVLTASLKFTYAMDPLVNLDNGWILGSTAKTFTEKLYYSFEKIPYAAPPTLKLRFQAPQPPQNWKGVLNCTYLDIACHQLTPVDYPQSEDCLYLNVFTPKLPQGGTNDSFPVMFYIHGGGFNDGSSKIYKPDNFINNDIILVTINYRLGPFGFISTQDEIIPGNFGLKDQHLALQWVHNHISLFSGDPKKVTIFGHSAGSASVGYHILNPKSEGLFWAAICQSGSFLGPWAYQRQPRKIAFKMASFINDTFIKNNNSKNLLEFLQDVEVEKINEAAKQFNTYFYKGRSEDIASLEGFSFAPSLEVPSKEAFVSEKMFGLIKAGKIIKVPLLIGFTTEENLNFHLDPDEVGRTAKIYDDDVTNLIPVDMEVKDFTTRTKIGQQIKNIYTNGTFSDNVGTAIRFSSDNDMKRPIMKQAEIFSKYSKTFFYVMSYDGVLGSYDVTYEDAGKVGHGEELMYLFCITADCDIRNYTLEDQITRDRLVKIWTDFAKFGNPTPEASELMENILWPQLFVDNDTFQYVDIGNNIEVKNFPNKEVYKKWNELYDSLGRDDFDTY